MLQWPPDARQNPVPGNVTGSVCDEDDDLGGVVPPANTLGAEQDLHETVQPGLRLVPVINQLRITYSSREDLCYFISDMIRRLNLLTSSGFLVRVCRCSKAALPSVGAMGIIGLSRNAPNPNWERVGKRKN